MLNGNIQGTLPTHPYLSRCTLYTSVSPQLLCRKDLEKNKMGKHKQAACQICFNFWFFSFYIEFFKSLLDKQVNIGQKVFDFTMVSQAAIVDLRICSTIMRTLVPVHTLSAHLSPSKPLNTRVHEELTILC